MAYRDQPLLFYEGDLAESLRQNAQRIQQKVDSIPQDQFLLASDEALVLHIVPEFQIVPLTLYEDRMVMERLEPILTRPAAGCHLGVERFFLAG